MGPVCLSCGQLGAIGTPSLDIPSQVDKPCERPDCEGRYRLLTNEEERELTAAWWIDGQFRNKRLYRKGRGGDEALHHALKKIKEDRT